MFHTKYSRLTLAGFSMMAMNQKMNPRPQFQMNVYNTSRITVGANRRK